MKQIKPETIKRWKGSGAILPKIDYNMCDRYYRIMDGEGEIVGASVHPLLAIKMMVGVDKAEMWEVAL